MKNRIETDLLMGELIYKHLRSEISREEQELLDSWAANPENKDFFFSLENTGQLYDKMLYIQDMDTDAQFCKLQCKMRKQVRRRMWQRWTGVAALLAVGIGCFWMWWQEKPQVEEPSVTVRPVLSPDRTVLVTAQGKQVFFADTVKNIVIPEQPEKRETTAALKYNILSTSSRGMVEMRLPDSSRVWLNAGSELRYLEKFAEDQRTVFLRGEAYFEVAKNQDWPFVVVAGETKVEVLGTQFNVRTTDETYCLTTLVEGCVKVCNRHRDSLVILPGQQAETRADGKLWMRPVDTRYFTAWRKNQFAFQEESLSQILTTLAEWYDFTFDIGDIQLASQIYTAIMPRTVQVDDILQLLEGTGDFEYSWAKDRYLLIRKHRIKE